VLWKVALAIGAGMAVAMAIFASAFQVFLGARQGIFDPFGLILISDPLGPGMPFLDIDTCEKRGGGDYLFLPGFSSLYDAIHGWMTRWMDGWKTSFHSRHPLIYVITFQITIFSKNDLGPLYIGSQGSQYLGRTLNIFGSLFGPKLLIKAETLTSLMLINPGTLAPRVAN